MKLYLIFQNYNSGYDTYDSAVVCAENEEAAKNIHPNGFGKVDSSERFSTWVTDVSQVTCEYLGEADKSVLEGVIVASFNAG